MRLKLSAKVTIPATWMDLGIVTLSEVRQRKTNFLSMMLLIKGILKKGTSEFIYKTEIELQM